MRSRIFTLLAALIGALSLSCSGGASKTGVYIGVLRFSIEALKSDASGRPVLNPPDLTVAYCTLPVWVPDGPRRAMASGNGMIVEASWDEVRSTRQTSNGAAAAVEFRNFRWSVKNPVRCGVNSISMVIPTVHPTLAVGPGLTPLRAPQRVSDSPLDPAWQKGLYGAMCVAWIPTLPNNMDEIDIVKRYQAARPAVTRTAPAAAQRRAPAGAVIRRPGYPR